MNTSLTPAAIESLQGRELDAAVAEYFMGLCYHEFERKHNGSRRAIKFVCSKCNIERFGGDANVPASYSENIKAIHEVENEIERRGLTGQYIEALSEIVAPEYASIFSSAIELDRHGADISGHNFLWRIRHATPEQCARAVLKAVSVNG